MTRGWAALSTAALLAVSGLASAQDEAPAADPPAQPPVAEPPAAEAEEEEDESIEVTVRAPPPRISAGQTQVRASDARTFAGTQGDTLKVVQNFPSVARAAFGGGQLVVWGSAPEDTRVYVDGVEVPSLYHVGGIRSVIPSGLVRSVELLPGGFGAEFGRALGGIARVETKTLPDKGIGGEIAADLYDAAASIQFAASPQFRVGIGARYSYVDQILAALVGPEIGDFYPLPRYHDGQIKVTAGLGAGQELSILASHSGDQLERVLPSSDPGARRSESLFALSERIALRYRVAHENGSATSVTPSFGFDQRDLSSDFGGLPARRESTSVRYGLRAEHRRALRAPSERDSPWSPRLDLVLGFDGLGTRTRSEREGSLTLPAREGDIFAFGQPPGEESSSDAWTAHVIDLAPYAVLELSSGPFTLVPGLRVNGTIIEASRALPRVGTSPGAGTTRFDPTLDPRLSLRVRVGERLAYAVSAGLYHQPPDPADLSAAFGTPELGPSKAVHVTLSQSAQLTELLSLELVGFYKELSDLPARTTLITPPLAMALTQDGEGEVFGANLLLRQAAVHGFSGWLSYSISRSERWHLGEETHRLFDQDQTHLLSAVASYAIIGFTFGARFRVGSGMPRTPVVGAYYNARDDRYEPIFGDHNSIRLPPFYQLDLRFEKAFEIGPTVLTAFADVQNVTNAANAEELAYGYDYGSKDFVTGLPVMGVAGASLAF